MAKVHTTNYFNTFIAVAEDSTAEKGEEPTLKGKEKTIANMQFELLVNKPYHYNSDDIEFGTYAEKKGLTEKEFEIEKQNFFSKGQPCLRCSPLSKKYGWGTHHNAEGKVAIYPLGSADYEKYMMDKTLKQTKAMRSKKA